MTGTTTKSAISKAGDRKAMVGAWPNRVSGRQNGRLGSAMRKCVATRVSQGGEKAWRTALGAPNMPEGDPNGECRMRGDWPGRSVTNRTVDCERSPAIKGRMERVMSSREGFIAYMGNDVFAVKWRNWKKPLKEQNSILSETWVCETVPPQKHHESADQ